MPAPLLQLRIVIKLSLCVRLCPPCPHAWPPLLSPTLSDDDPPPSPPPLQSQGVNVTALREVKLMRELHHPNIVRLLDVWPSRRGIALVFEYMETDLERVIRDRAVLLTGADVKAYLRMVLAGLAHCHARWVVHRDVKPDNFLLASSGALKLADFGLARPYGSPDRPFTHQVFARWYRAPELLYGSTCYGPGVDVWAAGCIFAELLLRRPWFSAESDVGVLNKIFTALGTPRDANWGGLRAMPAFVEFQPTPPAPLRSLFPNVAVVSWGVGGWEREKGVLEVCAGVVRRWVMWNREVRQIQQRWWRGVVCECS